MDCTEALASSGAAAPPSAASSVPGLDIIFANAEMLVVNKPFDVPMDGDVAAYGNTVESLVHQHMKDSGIFDEAHEQLQQAGKRKKQLKFVHQLDYSTSGVLCLAFTKDMAARLAHCFEMRTTRKYYLALLHGHIPRDASGDVDGAGEEASPAPSSFTAWVAQCNAAWQQLGRIVVEEDASDFRLLLTRPGLSAGTTAFTTGATTPTRAHRHATQEGADAEATVHAFHAAPTPTGCVSPDDSHEASPAVNPIEELVYATLVGDATAATDPAAQPRASSALCIDLPVGYDTSDAARFRMAATAEQSRPARTSLLVLQRTFLCLPAQSSLSCNEGRVERLPVTLVLLAPHTGRRHQLRVHCRAVGFPIVGDTAYCTDLDWCPSVAAPEGSWSVGGVRRMYLHAWRLLLPGTVTRPVSETERVSLKKKRRRETLGLAEQSGASVSEGDGEWTEFVAAPKFPDVAVHLP